MLQQTTSISTSKTHKKVETTVQTDHTCIAEKRGFRDYKYYLEQKTAELSHQRPAPRPHFRSQWDSKPLGVKDHFKNGILKKWTALARVDENCPRFVVAEMSNTGMGDIVSRLFVAVGIAELYGLTLALSEWPIHSAHFGAQFNLEVVSYEYLDAIENGIGVPISLFLLQNETVKYYNANISSSVNADVALYSLNFKDSLPCHSITILPGYCSTGWCFHIMSHPLQMIMRPLIEESIAWRKHSMNRYQHIQPQGRIPQKKMREQQKKVWNSTSLDDGMLNVVWHVRTPRPGYPSDDGPRSKEFYDNVNSLLANAFGDQVQRKNIVVHVAHEVVPPIFESMTNVYWFTCGDIMEAIHLFMETDVLVISGSSFPTIVAMMTPLHSPLVIQTHAMRAENAREKYTIVEGRAVRVDAKGVGIDYSAEEIRQIVTLKGILARINGNHR